MTVPADDAAMTPQILDSASDCADGVCAEAEVDMGRELVDAGRAWLACRIEEHGERGTDYGERAVHSRRKTANGTRVLPRRAGVPFGVVRRECTTRCLSPVIRDPCLNSKGAISNPGESTSPVTRRAPSTHPAPLESSRSSTATSSW